MEQVNEYLLKITGSFPVQRLDVSKEIKVTCADISVYETAKRDNFDGTFNIVYKGKPISFVEYVQDGVIVRGKDKSKKSVALRMRVMELADVLGEDREEFYTKFMTKLIPNVEEIWDHLKDL